MSVPCTFLSVCLQYTGAHKQVNSTGAHKTSLQYRCTQNQFTVQMYTKPVYSTDVRTQNQFTVQVYIKPVYSTGVHKTSLQDMYTQNQFTGHVYTKPDKSTLFIFFVIRLSHIEKLAAQKILLT